jgi:wobble nucleotide-excising tRNase
MKMRVRENEKLIRDSDNFAILNTDRSAIKRHEAKMADLNRKKAQELEINSMKQEISEIKSLMQELLKRI